MFTVLLSTPQPYILILLVWPQGLLCGAVSTFQGPFYLVVMEMLQLCLGYFVLTLRCLQIDSETPVRVEGTS